MDNMGGLQKLYYIDASDFISLTPDGNNLNTLVLQGGADIPEIIIAEEPGKISESEDESDHGTVYNFEASGRIPKCGPDNSKLFGDLKEKRLLILGKDNNDNFWLAGAPGSYFNILVSGTTGETAADLNARQLKISASLTTGCVFIVSPF